MSDQSHRHDIDSVDGIRCMQMRGGTSRGAFFLAEDLPTDPEERNAVLLRIMGTPDPRQIDGIGGAHPLTSKVAIVSASQREGVDVEYFFLQLGVEEPTVGTQQTCGNLLAGVGPFAVERGLVVPEKDTTTVRIYAVNTGDIASSTFATPGGRVDYDGDISIAGVPGTAGKIELEVGAGPDRALLPTGHLTDTVAGYEATLISNGMPVVMLRATDFGLQGDETPEELEAHTELTTALEKIRITAGPLMGLGEVADQTVPKMFLLSPPRHNGAITTRGFIPHRVHTSIGVLMGASIAAGVLIPGTVAAQVIEGTDSDSTRGNTVDDNEPVLLEHPTGVFPAEVTVSQDGQGQWHATSKSIRTARKLFDGQVFPRPRLNS